MCFEVVSNLRAGNWYFIALAIDEDVPNLRARRIVFAEIIRQLKREAIAVIFAREDCVHRQAQSLHAEKSDETAMHHIFSVIFRNVHRTISIWKSLPKPF